MSASTFLDVEITSEISEKLEVVSLRNNDSKIL
jgi:hypothetical protein